MLFSLTEQHEKRCNEQKQQQDKGLCPGADLTDAGLGQNLNTEGGGGHGGRGGKNERGGARNEGERGSCERGRGRGRGGE
ncbi:hypothetical protein COCON_G00015590 [Conger conger]|uniref:Uncharacterized protein n=1 Tax=Conger conger TaxID=82655 RepID=A0A9Q1I9E9_CONCO|nr:hypothetical protein COCON_G00015590 [Conger conger]